MHLSQIAASGRIEGNRVVYASTLPYADIHNRGGTIRVTAKTKIKIPRRQFIGRHPSFDAAVTDIIEKNLDEFLQTEFARSLQSKRKQQP